MRTLALATYVLLAGCTVDEATDTTGAVVDPDGRPMSDRSLNLQLSVVDETGAAVELNHFAAVDDVFLSVRAADASAPIVAEELAFVVTDKNGMVVSSDDARCRRFHVDEHGDITSIVEMCLHKVAHGSDGKVLIGVAPFYDAMKMTLKVTAADDESISVPFVVD